MTYEQADNLARLISNFEPEEITNIAYGKHLTTSPTTSSDTVYLKVKDDRYKLLEDGRVIVHRVEEVTL